MTEKCPSIGAESVTVVASRSTGATAQLGTQVSASDLPCPTAPLDDQLVHARFVTMLPSSTLKSIWRGSRPAYVPAIKSGVRIADVDEGSCPADREDFLGGIVRCIGRDLEEVAGREPDTAVDFVVERARGGAGPLEGERAVVEAGLVEPPELPTAPRPCAPPRAAAGGANADAGVAGEEPNAPAAVAAVRPTAMPIPMPTTTTRSLISHPLRCMSPSARCDDVPHPLYSTGGISNFCRQQKRSSGSPTGPRPRPPQTIHALRRQVVGAAIRRRRWRLLVL
jgi:hypothetical protein